MKIRSLDEQIPESGLKVYGFFRLIRTGPVEKRKRLCLIRSLIAIVKNGFCPLLIS
jgi:hypothetical protein